MKKKSNWFWGIFLIIIGLIFLIDTINFLDIDISLVCVKLWPVGIIILGIFYFVNRFIKQGVFFTVLGVLFFLSTLMGWTVWNNFWPIILITYGFLVLVEIPLQTNKENYANNEKMDEDNLSLIAILCGIEKVVNSESFKGGNVNCLLGGVKVDLRNAKISKEGAVLNINCALGGVELLVSQNYQVVTEGMPIMGGWENKFVAVSDKKLPVLKIKGFVALGGVEIK